MKIKQNELKNYQLQLNEIRMKISEVKDWFLFYLIFIYIYFLWRCNLFQVTIKLAWKTSVVLNVIHVGLMIPLFWTMKNVYPLLKWPIQKEEIFYIEQHGMDLKHRHFILDVTVNLAVKLAVSLEGKTSCAFNIQQKQTCIYKNTKIL